MNHLMQPRTMLQKSQAGHSKYASSHQLCLHHIICPPRIHPFSAKSPNWTHFSEVENARNHDTLWYVCLPDSSHQRLSARVRC